MYVMTYVCVTGERFDDLDVDVTCSEDLDKLKMLIKETIDESHDDLEFEWNEGEDYVWVTYDDDDEYFRVHFHVQKVDVI